jgi:hypothetical protein
VPSIQSTADDHLSAVIDDGAGELFQSFAGKVRGNRGARLGLPTWSVS